MNTPTPGTDPYIGRMNDPTASARLRGPCGDEMEFHLDIRDGRIEEASTNAVRLSPSAVSW